MPPARYGLAALFAYKSSKSRYKTMSVPKPASAASQALV